jgi:GNAT superfamily N-acetyltransferase
MKITLREDLDPDTGFYFNQQFKIYHEPYLIWDRETWDTVLTLGNVYRIEVDGRYAGDVIFEDRRKGKKYIVDFSLLPDYQKQGIGRRVLEQVKQMGEKFTAVTRKETLDFFLKSGFLLKKTIRDYYYPGVDGYYIIFCGKAKNQNSH